MLTVKQQKRLNELKGIMQKARDEINSIEEGEQEIIRKGLVGKMFVHWNRVKDLPDEGKKAKTWKWPVYTKVTGIAADGTLLATTFETRPMDGRVLISPDQYAPDHEFYKGNGNVECSVVEFDKAVAALRSTVSRHAMALLTS